jgi:uncharacterized membrane protein YfcA
MLVTIDPLYVLSGFVVGLLVGQTGVGGGSLMTPLLVLVFGIHPVAAVGTDLLYAAATKSVGSLVHGLNHTVNWRVVRLLACGSLPATAATLFVMSQIDLGQSAGEVINTLLGCALLLTAGALLFRRQLMAWAGPWLDAVTPQQTQLLTVAVGVVLGTLVTISSVGAGALGVTALLLLYPGAPMAVIVGSDIAHAVPLTLLAGFGHWLIGSVDLHLLASLLVGSVPGIVLGSYVVARVPDAVARPILAAVLTVVGGRLVL